MMMMTIIIIIIIIIIIKYNHISILKSNTVLIIFDLILVFSMSPKL